MRLLLNYKGMQKILNKFESYQDIVQFVNEKFFLRMSKWHMVYIDSDGDTISLDSQLDVDTMLETVSKDHQKIYIKDHDEYCQEKGLQIDIQDLEILPVEEKIEAKQQGSVQEKVNDEEKNEKKYEIQVEEKKAGAILQEQLKNQNIQHKHQSENQKKNLQEKEQENCGIKMHCQWRKQWKKKMQEKMAKFVDNRVETLLPSLIKKIENGMKNEKPQAIENNGVKHQVKCTGCGIQPITGIRYKCLTCPLFNYCSSCEETLPHTHNMLKMRFLEEQAQNEEEEIKLQNPWKKWKKDWKKGCHEKDQNLSLTKKCFKLSKIFEAKPEIFREFVQANKNLKIDQLSEKYQASHQQTDLKDQAKEDLAVRIQKLAFYYKEPTSNFEQIVKKNPIKKFKQLVKMINQNKALNDAKESQKDIKDVQEQKQQQQAPQKDILVIKEKTIHLDEQKEQSSISSLGGSQKKQESKQKQEQKSNEQQKKQQAKQKEQIKQVSEVKPEIPDLKIEAPALEEPKKGWFNWFSEDPKKRNECLIQMKQLFGQQNVFEYSNFYSGNSKLSNEQIINKYIEKQFNSK